MWNWEDINMGVSGSGLKNNYFSVEIRGTEREMEPTGELTGTASGGRVESRRRAIHWKMGKLEIC